MILHQNKKLLKAFITSQFSYCPLVWMIHGRVLNNRINNFHERALQITYQNTESTFQKSLEADNSVSIHHRNLQVLATELFKIFKNESPSKLKDLFFFFLHHGYTL